MRGREEGHPVGPALTPLTAPEAPFARAVAAAPAAPAARAAAEVRELDRRGLLVGLAATLLALAAALVALDLLEHKSSLLPAFFVAGALFPLLLLQPQWIVPAFLAFTWTSIGRSNLGGLSPVNYGSYVLLPLAAWYAWTTRREQARAAIWVFGLIALPLVITGLLAVTGREIPTDWFKDLAFLFIAAICLRRPDIERTLVALVLVGIFLSLGAVYSVRVHPTSLFGLDPTECAPGHPCNDAPRAAGPFGESNFFALSLATLMPMALYLIGRGGWRQRIGIVAVPCLIAGIYATGSRGGALAGGAAILVVSLLSGDRRVRIGGVAAIVAAGLLLLLFSAQASSSASRTVSGRTTENLIAWAMFKDYPIVGVGPDQYPMLYSLYTPKIGNDNRTEREPHSLPLQILAEQGLVGLLGWIGAIIFLARLTYTRRVWDDPTGRIVILSIVTYLLGSLFLHGSELRLLWILAGMLIAVGVWGAPPVARRRSAPTAGERRARLGRGEPQWRWCSAGLGSRTRSCAARASGPTGSRSSRRARRRRRSGWRSRRERCCPTGRPGGGSGSRPVGRAADVGALLHEQPVQVRISAAVDDDDSVDLQRAADLAQEAGVAAARIGERDGARGAVDRRAQLQPHALGHDARAVVDRGAHAVRPDRRQSVEARVDRGRGPERVVDRSRLHLPGPDEASP